MWEAHTIFRSIYFVFAIFDLLLVAFNFFQSFFFFHFEVYFFADTLSTCVSHLVAAKVCLFWNKLPHYIRSDEQLKCFSYFSNKLTHLHRSVLYSVWCIEYTQSTANARNVIKVLWKKSDTIREFSMTNTDMHTAHTPNLPETHLPKQNPFCPIWNILLMDYCVYVRIGWFHTKLPTIDWQAFPFSEHNKNTKR